MSLIFSLIGRSFRPLAFDRPRTLEELFCSDRLRVSVLLSTVPVRIVSHGDLCIVPPEVEMAALVERMQIEAVLPEPSFFWTRPERTYPKYPPRVIAPRNQRTQSKAELWRFSARVSRAA